MPSSPTNPVAELVQNEPVLATITALVTASIGVLVAFGITFTAAQTGAIVAFVGAVYGMGILLRKYVWTPKSVAKALDAAQATTKADITESAPSS